MAPKIAEESFGKVWREAAVAMCLSLAETFEEEWGGRVWTSGEIGAKLRHVAASYPDE